VLQTARVAEMAAERGERARIQRETAAKDAIDRPHGFISRFDPLQESYSLGELCRECEFCQAVHFINKQVFPQAVSGVLRTKGRPIRAVISSLDRVTNTSEGRVFTVSNC
jgi:hypothetical protein